MAHHDPQLKMYADNGLRSAPDWSALGREVHEGATPRARSDHRTPVALYTRDQTRARVSRRRPERGDAPAAPAAPGVP
jgi:hypothetical protein